MKLRRRSASTAGQFSKVAAIGATLFFCCGTLSAASIIFGTGLDNSGSFLNPGDIDPHYSLIMGGTNAYVAYGATIADSSRQPVPPGWPLADRYISSPNSQWIAPSADLIDITGSESYEYVTSFDLSAFDPANFSITGRFSVDNTSGGVFINGNLVPNTTIDDIYSYLGFINFTITSGFKPGMNTLAFVVGNSPMFVGAQDPNPTGLIVDISGAGPVSPADPNAPEPAVLWLTACGFIVLALKRHKWA